MKKIKFTHPAIEDDPRLEKLGHILVDGENIVCPNCRGTGTSERTDIDCSLLIDDMMEDGDNEGLANYNKGEYHEICPECQGNNVIFSPILPDWAAKEIDEYHRCEAEDMEYAAQERACGA